MFISSDNENANLWVQTYFALIDYTLDKIISMGPFLDNMFLHP